MKSITAITLLLSFSCFVSAFTPPPPPPPPVMMPNAAMAAGNAAMAAGNATNAANAASMAASQQSTGATPKRLQLGSQYYTGDIYGLRQYVDSLQSTNQGLYQTLNTKLLTLESQFSTARTISTASNYAALGMVVGGLTVFKEDWDGPGKKPNTTMIYGGVGLWIIGSIVANRYAPSSSDYLNFINEHNRLNPNNSLNLSLNTVPKNDGLGINLAYNF